MSHVYIYIYTHNLIASRRQPLPEVFKDLPSSVCLVLTGPADPGE